MLPYSTFVNKSNKTIYINPNFKGELPMPDTIQSMQSPQIPKNTYINPLFLKTDKFRNAIHMNPVFLRKFQERQEINPEIQKDIMSCSAPKVALTQSNNISPIHSSERKVATEERKIIRKSKNCLIREPLVKRIDPLIKSTLSPVALQPLLVLNKRKLVRKVSLPESIKIPNNIVNNDFSAKITKYKIDNRLTKRKPLLPPTPRIKRTSFVGRYALRRTSFSEPTNTSAKTFNHVKNKKLKVLNINGLFYKSTQNSLKLKGVTRNQILKSYNSNKSRANPNLDAHQGLTIFVRGNKYVMDANKFKLTRVTNCDPTSNREKDKICKAVNCQRIDIGGYTYISTNSTKNVLVRTTNHLSRAYVHNAKQKSLQTLAKQFIKTNIPCPIFQHIGKCAAFHRGKCSKVHNKLQVSICTKFLRGECHNSKCLLSHNVSLSKMPVCKYYLQGVCVRNDCPYLHKKLSNTTEICTEFLRGFCQMADKCDKRHEFACLDVERNNKCNNKNCFYCNAKKRKESQIKLKSAKLKSEIASVSELSSSASSKENIESQPCQRYFIESNEKNSETSTENTDKHLKEEVIDDTNITEISQENTENSVEIRPKLGVLPAYIPL